MNKNVQNFDYIINYQLCSDKETIFGHKFCKTNLSPEMADTDIWAYIAHSKTSINQERFYFVNIYGQLKIEKIHKANHSFKIYSYSNKYETRSDDKRKYYGKYVYATPGAIHRLVAFAFLPKPESENYEIDHIDGNPSNNNLSNLRWVSHTDNQLNPVRRRRQKVTCQKKWIDAWVQHSKLGIVAYNLDFSEKIGTWKTDREAAKALGISVSAVHSSLKRQQKCLNFNKAACKFWIRHEMIYWYTVEKCKSKNLSTKK